MSEGYTLQPKELEVDGYENKEFVRAFKYLQKDMHDINEAHGFNEDDHLIDRLEVFLKQNNADSDSVEVVGRVFRNARAGLKIALVMSELGEALEAIRKGNEPDNHIPQFTGEEAEYADAIIRLMNAATDRNLRLAEALVAKNEYNRARPFRHGGKKF